MKKRPIENGRLIREIVRRRMNEGFNRKRFLTEMALYWDDEERKFLLNGLKWGKL